MRGYAISLDDVHDAARRIAGWAHVTPVMTCATLNRRAGKSLFFKCEQWQKVGAFKFRGACNAIRKLEPESAAAGVVTHSSGNHAQAVALAARMRGIPAHIVMPRTAPVVKRRAVEDYGGRVIECEPTLPARETTTAQVQAETRATLIPPYNHADVMAGQGTAALELLEQAPLIPRIRIFAAEPLGADDAARSKAAGKLIPQTGPKTIADGLLTSLGDLTWPVLRDQVERVITVSEEQIIEAMRLMWERAKLLIEPSAAVAVAAALSAEFRDVNVHHVGIVLSGGNVDLERLPW
jgi:threonine dehydratase